MGLLRKIETYALSFLPQGRALPIQIDITNACNLKCVHCYHPHHKNENALNLAQWLHILDDYFSLIARLNYTAKIILCGGEPTISPHFKRILDYLFQKGPEISITILSNGTTLNESIVKQLLPFNNLSFQISLDGPDSQRHDLIRGRGSFDRTMRGAELLNRHRVGFNFLCVLSKRSSYWIEDFFRLAKEVGPRAMNFTRLIENGVAIKMKESFVDRTLEPFELRDAYTEIVKFSSIYNIKTRTEGPLYSMVYPGLGRNGRFWESIVIDYEGYFLASSRSRLRLGSVLNQSLEDLFLNNDLFQKLRKGKIEVCGDCRFLGVCGGDRNASFAAHGNFLGPDPGCWITTPIIAKTKRGKNESNDNQEIYINGAHVTAN